MKHFGNENYSPENYRYVGRVNVPRKDAREIVTGKCTFLDDFSLPQLLIGRAKRSPHAHARIKSINVEKARALNGVAAETREIADEAIELIEVEYEVLPAVTSGIEAIKDGAPQLYPGMFKNNIVTPGYPPFQKDGPFWHLVKGDPEKGFEECAYIAEDTVEFSKMAAPASPEPPGAIVRWEGGSYGNKQSQVQIVSSAAVLSMKTGRPVKFYQTKAEQMCCFETCLGSQVHAKIGMDKDGVVKAVKAEWTVDTGCLSNATQGQIGVGIGEAQLVMCKCPNWDLDTNLVVTNKQPAGIVRGYGGQELNSCLSLLIGRTMREGGFDPVECYKKNYVGEGDVYTWRDGRQWQAHSVSYVKAIEAAAEKFGWKDKWKGWGVPTWTSDDGRYVRGVGCGIIGNADIGEDNTEAYVRVVPDLVGDKARIVLQTNITESGMGQRSNIVKMVAEIMNVPFDKVDITPGDTMINPTGFGLCGSRGTITYGHAVSSAAEDAKHKLFELAKPYLEVAEDSMYLTDYGVATVARPGKFVSWKKLIPQDLTLTGYGQHLENFSTPNMFIVFLEVQVDRETGKVDVLNMLGGTDCGQIIDPSGLEMQAQGGIGSASLDTATFEEHIIDPGTGRTMTYDMIEYKWRPFNEFPEYETCFLESQFDTFQFKATGVGEIAGAAAASATMQAISNAIGVQVAQYPATPDVILKALGKI